MLAPKLLTINQAKLEKSKDYGFFSVGLQLEPTYKLPVQLAGVKNTCSYAGRCRITCLDSTGRNRFDLARQARIRRTQLLATYPNLFFRHLDHDLELSKLTAYSHDLQLTARLNTISDVPFERILTGGSNVLDRHPEIQFLDYTKNPGRLDLKIPNYHVVYSYNEKSDPKLVQKYLLRGGQVAMVFASNLPQFYKIGSKRFRVIEGDSHDLLHLRDPGVIVGLKYKKSFSRRTGKAQQISANGFILD
jgi:hypothetical protein